MLTTKMKYLLNIYKNLESYPTDEDFLYELSLNQELLNEKLFTIDNIKKYVSFDVEQYDINLFLNKQIEKNNIKIIKKKDKVFYTLNLK